MNIRLMDYEPKITIEASMIQKMRDYARLSTVRTVFGGSFSKSKNEIYLDNLFIVPQESDTYSCKPDMDEWSNFIDTQSEKDNEFIYSVMGIVYPSSYKLTPLAKSDIKDFEDSIGKIFYEYIFIQVNKLDEINIGIINSDKQIIIEDIPYEIDYSFYGEADSEILEEMKNISTKTTYSYSGSKYGYTSGTSYTTGYKDDTYYDSKYNVKTLPPPVYKDAPINTENPDYKDLV